MIGKKDYITVMKSKSTHFIDPYLLAIELHTFDRGSDTISKIHTLKENNSSETSMFKPETIMMLLGENIPFNDYIDIQPDFILLELYKLSEILYKVNLKKDHYKYIIDVSSAPTRERHEIIYPTVNPEEIRPRTYGSISCEDFFNLPTKKDFCYGLIIDIPNYINLDYIEPEKILQIFPWPIKFLQLKGKDLQLTLKIPDLDFIPNPRFVLKLIIDYHTKASEYLKLCGHNHFDLKLVDLDAIEN